MHPDPVHSAPTRITRHPETRTRPRLPCYEDVGRYRIIERIGAGGMAEVFAAVSRVTDLRDPVVAIKRIRHELVADDTFLRMFLEEARIAGHLQHPNIIRIHELAQADGDYYMAMELVPGKDLAQVLHALRRKGERMPPEMAAWITATVCSALQYAHQKRDHYGRSMRLIHRDVSPPNILLGFEGDVKLIDFGIAKAASRSLCTKQGIVKGKLRYISPEQTKGRECDHRADIYSLGACLYEMISGEPVVSPEGGDVEIIERLREGRVRPLAEICPDVPVRLRNVTMTALSPDPKDRYQSAGEFAQALHAFLLECRPYGRPMLRRFMNSTFATEADDFDALVSKALSEVRRAGPPAEGGTMPSIEIVLDEAAEEATLPRISTGTHSRIFFQIEELDAEAAAEEEEVTKVRDVAPNVPVLHRHRGHPGRETEKLERIPTPRRSTPAAFPWLMAVALAGLTALLVWITVGPVGPGSLRVLAPKGLSGNVFVDGKPKGPAPAMIEAVPVGAHTVTFAPTAGAPFAFRVAVQPGRETQLVVLPPPDREPELAASAPPAVASAADAEPKAEPPRTAEMPKEPEPEHAAEVERASEKAEAERRASAAREAARRKRALARAERARSAHAAEATPEESAAIARVPAPEPAIASAETPAKAPPADRTASAVTAEAPAPPPPARASEAAATPARETPSPAAPSSGERSPTTLE